MKKADEKRVDRLLNDLMWLASQDDVDLGLDGADLDAIGYIRSKLDDAYEASQRGES